MSFNEAVSMGRRLRWKLLSGLITTKLHSRFMALARGDTTREYS
jgi:hypothetical protein